ncbi:MAG: fused MFS/spermidine synthase [Planctomycetota bacterium]|jgi:spermidine synthase
MAQLGDMRRSGRTLVISKRASINWIMLIYFVSGACSLIDEVVWVRLLKLTLGNTVYATSIVVSVFMGGLALGALIMGRYCDRVRMRLRLYALLETLVTISALSLPWLLKLADIVYVWFYRTYHPSHALLLIVQVVISAVILLGPSMLMGSTLPLLGRFVTALEAEAGHLVGKLYALNTLGAAAGCFLAGFALIRAFGLMGALYTAAGLNLVVAFGGWFLSRFSKVTDQQQSEASAVKVPESLEGEKTDGRFYLLILAFFMSGLISIGYELLWMRSIVHLLGGFTYVFSAVLTVYLLGNVIGAAIGSRLAMRLKTPAVGFAVTLSILGVCGILYLPMLIFWTSDVMPQVKQILTAAYSWIPVSSYTIRPLAQSLFLFLVPAIIMGIGFPIALQAWANHIHKVGRSTGTAYGANTIGAVVGGVITGFVLIPLLGVQISISILGLIGIWIAGVMWLSFAHGSKIAGRWALLGVAVFFTIFTVKTPSNLFDTVVKTSPMIPDWELVWVKEGVTTTVSLHRDLDDGSLQLHSSGQSIAGDSYIERGDQKMLGHFGVFLNSDAKKILSVGFGSGETTACLAQHRIEKVDCVEIAPEVVDVSLKFFRHINLGDRLDEEIKMIFMDAKNYIHLTDSNYDVIINDSIHPRDFAENASLYTKEYFESAREHLNEDGIIMSWLPTYYMPASVFNSIIGTLMDVFRYVTIWYPTAHPAPLVLIAGSQQQQYFSVKHIENELREEGVRGSLSKINIHNSVDVLSCYVGDQDDLRKFVKTFSVNSDYWPFVEFTTDSRTPENQIFTRFVKNVRGDSIYEHIDWTGFSKEEKEKWLQRYQVVYKASNHLFMSNASDINLDKLKHCMDGLAILPDSTALLSARAEVEKLLYFDSVGMIEAVNPDKAMDLADEMLKIYPQSATAWIIKAGVKQEKGDMQGALAAAQRAVDVAPDNAEAHFNLGFVLFRMGQFDKAIAEYKEMVRLSEQAGPINNYKQAQMLDAFAAVYAAAGWLDEAIVTAERALEFAVASGQQEMVEHIKKRLKSFKAARAGQQRR